MYTRGEISGGKAAPCSLWRGAHRAAGCRDAACYKSQERPAPLLLHVELMLAHLFSPWLWMWRGGCVKHQRVSKGKRLEGKQRILCGAVMPPAAVKRPAPLHVERRARIYCWEGVGSQLDLPHIRANLQASKAPYALLVLSQQWIHELSWAGSLVFLQRISMDVAVYQREAACSRLHLPAAQHFRYNTPARRARHAVHVRLVLAQVQRPGLSGVVPPASADACQGSVLLSSQT